MGLTRLQLIDVINQYIYANNNKKITAPQLNEILNEIAKAFAMEGTSAGIEQTLAKGSSVSDGRAITNGQGGKLHLSATVNLDELVFNYLGIDMTTPTLEGVWYNSIIRSAMGNLRRQPGSTETFFDMIGKDVLSKGEALSAAIYFAGQEPDEFDQSSDGVLYVTVSDAGRNELGVAPDRIVSNVKSPDGVQQASTQEHSAEWIRRGVIRDRNATTRNQSSEVILRRVNTGKAPFDSALTAVNHTWTSGTNIVSIIGDGFKVEQAKKLFLGTDGSAPTAGLVAIAGESTVVSTAAVRANSVISFTVQEGGSYTGNVRVTSKTPGVGFTLGSSIDGDNCNVFWQIIDLEGLGGEFSDEFTDEFA